MKKQLPRLILKGKAFEVARDAINDTPPITKRMGNYKDLDSLTEGTHFESPEAKLERTKKEGFPTVAMDEYISRRTKKKSKLLTYDYKTFVEGIIFAVFFLAFVELLSGWLSY